MTQRLSTITQDRTGSSSRGGWLLAIVSTPADMLTPRIVRLSEAVLGIDRSPGHHPGGLVIGDPSISNGKTLLSRVHAGYELQDRGARNPVRVNGSRVSLELLGPDDVIRVGNTVLIVDKDSPSRAARKSGAFDGDDTRALVEKLQLHQSTQACRFCVDASLHDPSSEMTLVRSPCPVSCRAIGEWLASATDRELVIVPGDARDVLDRIEAAPANALVTLERADRVPADRIRSVVDALERHIDGGASIVVTLDDDVDDHVPEPVQQLFALRSGSVLEVPALRDRKLDVLPAMERWMEQVHPGSSIGLDAAIIERLIVHDWPDGLSELRKVADRLSRSVARGVPMTEALLPQSLGVVDPDPDEEGEDPLSELAIWNAFKLHEGNMSRVAKQLSLSRGHLYRRLRALGLTAQVLRSRLDALESGVDYYSLHNK